MYDEILEKVIASIKESTNTEEPIDGDSGLIEDIGLNSIAVLSLLAEWEEIFGIEIPEKYIRKMGTVDDVVEVIESLMS